MSLYWLALFVNHELGEIPLDEARKWNVKNFSFIQNGRCLLSQGATLLMLEIFPQRSSFVSVDVDLFEQIKVRVVLHGEAHNVLRTSWFLINKIIG